MSSKADKIVEGSSYYWYSEGLEKMGTMDFIDALFYYCRISEDEPNLREKFAELKYFISEACRRILIQEEKLKSSDKQYSIDAFNTIWDEARKFEEENKALRAALTRIMKEKEV